MTPRPHPLTFFKQTLKSDDYVADEIINVFLLRPIAAVLVWLVYPTHITPNQLTIAAILIGCSAAGVYAINTPSSIAIAGLLVSAKDIVDDADGQLARAKQLYSRRGRFLDSIGDFIVDVALFSAITFVVYTSLPSFTTILLGVLSFVGITLRVSYHVFYQVSFLHREGRYALNRIIEEVTPQDRDGDRVALRLQLLFNFIYTWQDRLMFHIDKWCKADIFSEDEARMWYSDTAGLRVSGLLGFGTEFALLTICSVTNNLHPYLLLNVFLMNGIWITSILYRRFVLRSRIRPAG